MSIRKTALAAALAMGASLGLASNSAFATLDANIPGATNINSYDVSLGTINGTDYWLDNINQINWTGFEFSDFGTTGAPNIVGSTFTSYILLNATSANDQFGGTQNSCLNNQCEVTAFVKAEGVITGVGGLFSYTNLLDFEVYLDNLNVGTAASGNNLAGYFDGTFVLTGGNLASLTNPPIANTGNLNPVVGAGGSFNFQNQLLEVPGQTFFWNEDRTESLFSSVAPEGLFALTEGQITLQGLQFANSLPVFNPQVPASSIIFNNFINYFGIASSNTLSLALVQTSPTTNVAANPVPEPSILALLGAGLVGMGIIRRRRFVA